MPTFSKILAALMVNKMCACEASQAFSFVLLCFDRWFDVLQKVSTQLKTSISSVTKHRADKVIKMYTCFSFSIQISCSAVSL